MRILITGSNGLLGSKLIDALVADSIDFLATSRGENRNPLLPAAQFATLDTTSEQDVLALLDRYQPTVVIHSAAMTQVDECEFHRKDAWNANVEAVRIMAEGCAARGIHLIHIGTDFIFDGAEGPYDEDGVPNPLSYYGFTKWMADQVVMHTPKLKWSILRTVLVFIYSASLGRSNIVLWLKGVLEKGQEVNIVDDQYRSPTLAEDLAQACLSAAKTRARGIYHISGPETYSILDLAKAVAAHYGKADALFKPVSSVTLNQPALRPPRTGFVIDKARRDLDYKPHTLQEALALMDEQMAESSGI